MSMEANMKFLNGWYFNLNFSKKIFKAKVVYFLFILLLAPTASLTANEGIDRAKAFFADLVTLEGHFSQKVQGAQLNVTDQSSGYFVIKRPGQFRWVYTVPYAQEIVADGAKIWVYDEDLEQVTIKAFNAMLGSTPAALLSGNTPLQENFIMEEVAPDGIMLRVQLSPKDNEASFTQIILGFVGRLLVRMELMDNLGQLTLLTFTDIRKNQSVNAVSFQFDIPKNADVFDTTK